MHPSSPAPPGDAGLPWPSGLRVLPPDPGPEPAEVDLVEIRGFERPDQEWITRLAPVGPDRFVTGGPGVCLRLWSTAASAPMATLGPRRDDPAPVALGVPEGCCDPVPDPKLDALAVLDTRTVVTTSSDGVLRHWDLDMRRCVHALRIPPFVASLVALDTGRVAFATPELGVLVFAREGVQAVRRLPLDGCEVLLALGPDRMLASVIDEDDLYLVDLAADRVTHLTADGPSLFAACALTPSRYVSAAPFFVEPPRLNLWELGSEDPLRDFPCQWSGDVIAPLGPGRIAYASFGCLDIWSVTDGRLLARADRPYCSTVAVLPGRRDGVVRLATGGRHHLSLWELRPQTARSDR